jgi:hypothetical protein
LDDGVGRAIDASAAGRDWVAAADCPTAILELVVFDAAAAGGGVLGFIVAGHGREV